MIDLGIVKPGSTIRIPFSSFDKDDGSAITMTNFAAADILIYKDGSTTERASTAGFTATTDFDAKTGKHLAIIDLADNTTAGFYSVGSEYIVAIDSVTVDAVTTGGWIARFVIGYNDATLNTTIASYTNATSFTLTDGPAEDDAINGRWAVIHDTASRVQCSWVEVLDYTGSTRTVTLAAGATFTAAAGDGFSLMGPTPLRATTIGRTLDVSSTGEAGLDWANIGSPTTSQTLSGTTVGTATAVTTVNGLAAGVITATSIANDAITDSKVASDVTIASVTGAVGSVTGNVGGNVIGSVASVTGNVGGNVVGSVASVTARVTANTDQLAGQTVTAAAGVTFPTSVASPTNITAGTITTVTTLTGHTPQTGDVYALANGANGFVATKADTAAILLDTGTDGVVVAAASKTGFRLSATGVGDILTTALTESYAADGAAPTLSQALFAIQQMMQERSITSTTMTVNRLDGTTAAFTLTLNDATSPTAITRAT